VNARIALMKQRAFFGECDLVVRGQQSDREVGFLYSPLTGLYDRDKLLTLPYTDAQLRALTSSTQLTFTAVPPRSGRRIALDRDSDGIPDGND
jgi:hypothetical protein